MVLESIENSSDDPAGIRIDEEQLAQTPLSGPDRISKALQVRINVFIIVTLPKCAAKQATKRPNR